MDISEQEVRHHFNAVGSRTAQEAYEHQRWARNERAREQYRQTEQFIRGTALPYMGTATRILELGPGPGTWTKMLGEAYPGATFTLTDISSEMLSQARSQLSSGQVHTLEGDFLSVEIPSEPADIFFSSRAIEYVDDKPAAARKILTILSSGGRGCVITKTPKRLFHTLSGYVPSALHQGQVAPDMLVRALREAGAKDIHLFPVSLSFPLLKQASADRMLFKVFGNKPLNIFSALFSESYAVLFTKK